VLEEDQEVDEMSEVIRIEKLTKTYGKKRGVTELDLHVNEKEIYGFIGPNGAGKSTTIRSILGFLNYDSGRIEVFGKDSIKEHTGILREIGYMPSEALFYPAMKVSEVIKFAADVRGLDCRKEADMLCERLKLDTGKRIKELSLGNRKKVSIVCAMQHKPRLFIFDEPSSGLDPLMQNTFFELIEEYVAAGSTCMLSTHVLSEVKRYCKHVAIMKEGHLVSAGSVSELTHTSSKRVVATIDGERKEYLYTKDMNSLIRELSEKNVTELSITDPSIEDIFMGYYGEER
jgi:ABC-2 type transport system ATP-binding protein